MASIHGSWPRRAASALTLLCAALTGCATSSTGNPISSNEWIEVKSPHFTVSTDESLEEAQRAALRLERTRAALLGAAWPGVKPPEEDPAQVIVVGDELGFEELFSRRVDALSTGRFNSLIVLHGDPDRWDHRDTLAAEGSSSVLKQIMVFHLEALLAVQSPPWLRQGLAQFLATLQIAKDGRSAQLGMVNMPALTGYNQDRAISISDVLRWNGRSQSFDEVEAAGRSGLTWAIVHWLYNEHPDAFAAYQIACAHGMTAEQAWAAALPGLPPAEADHALHVYIQHGDYRVFTIRLPPLTAATLTHRALAAPEVHVLKARLAAIAASLIPDGKEERKALAQRELDEAMKLDPGSLPALEYAFDEAGTPKEKEAFARRAVKAHPEAGRAWAMLGESFGDEDTPEKEQALLKAAVLLPHDSEPLNSLAWARVKHGHAATALPYAMKAVHLAPGDPNVIDTYAAALFGVGRCAEAVTAEQRAIALLPPGISKAISDGFEQRLAQFQKGCTATK